MSCLRDTVVERTIILTYNNPYTGHFIQCSPVYKLVGTTLQQSWGSDRQGLLPFFVDEETGGFSDFPKSRVHVQYTMKLRVKSSLQSSPSVQGSW